VSFCTQCGQALRPVPRLAQPREERRRVSVLFIDVIGSTPFAERTDPETCAPTG
jgi:class 3 adenylate cyclase